MSLGLFKKCYHRNVFTNQIYLICMYEQDLTFNNLQWLIRLITQPAISTGYAVKQINNNNQA